MADFGELYSRRDRPKRLNGQAPSGASSGRPAIGVAREPPSTVHRIIYAAPETFILKCVKLHRVNKIKDLATMQPMKRLSKAVPALTAGLWPMPSRITLPPPNFTSSP